MRRRSQPQSAGEQSQPGSDVRPESHGLQNHTLTRSIIIAAIRKGRYTMEAREIWRAWMRRAESAARASKSGERQPHDKRGKEIEPSSHAGTYGVSVTATVRRRPHDNLESGGDQIAIDDRQHHEAAPGVVVAIENRDRQKVGHLPAEKNAEQDHASGVTFRCGRPSHCGGNRARHRAHQRAKRRVVLERRIDKDVAGKRDGGERCRQRIDEVEQISQSGNGEDHPKSSASTGAIRPAERGRSAVRSISRS